jgi:hypothetical protein
MSASCSTASATSVRACRQRDHEGKDRLERTTDRLDYATLSGEMKLEASKGQFLKLDPGAGKLLGLISLQTLPRRFSLDFGDVFSQGFAFDSIQGSMSSRAASCGPIACRSRAPRRGGDARRSRPEE